LSKFLYVVSSSLRRVIGTNTFGVTPIVVPSKPRGATPTIVSVRPFTMSVWPTTEGSDAKRDCQYA